MDLRMRSLAAALACAVGWYAAAALAADAPKAVTHTIIIEGMRFEPAVITVSRGDTVVWRNKDPFPHTATANGAFDSHAIAGGKSWRFNARAAGEYTYICTLHPNMKGTLIVR